MQFFFDCKVLNECSLIGEESDIENPWEGEGDRETHLLHADISNYQEDTDCGCTQCHWGVNELMYS